MTETNTYPLPQPVMAPLGIPITPEYVQEAWDTFVKPAQDSGTPQSGEMRILMGILRAVDTALRSVPINADRDVTEPTSPAEDPAPRQRGTVVTICDRNSKTRQPLHIPGDVHINGQPILLAGDGLDVRTNEQGTPIVTLSLIPAELHYTQEPAAPTSGDTQDSPAKAPVFWRSSDR